MDILREIGIMVKPTLGKVLLFIMFAFLWIAGVIQTYAFIDDVPGLEKPPLYDYLRPFSFWFSWLVFSAPFYLLSTLLCTPVDFCSAILSSFPDMGAVKFPLAGVIYSYAAASFTAYTWRTHIKTPRKKRQTLLTALIPTIILNGTMFFILLIEPNRILFVLSSYLTMYLVMLFYVISIYGAYKIIRNVINRGVGPLRKHRNSLNVA